MKIRNIIFSVIIGFVLIGPIGLACAQKVVSLPGWLTSASATYLAGSVSKVDLRANLSIEAFQEGKLQSALQTQIANYIPLKAGALLGNAALQRSLIASSNVLFDWDSYPTFYGSSYLCIPDAQRLIKTPSKMTDEQYQTISAAAEAFKSFASSTTIPVTLFMPPSTLVPVAIDNPIDDLISQPITYDDFGRIFKEGDPTYTWVDDLVSYKDFCEDWYRTDHHWNAYGMYAAYQRIATALGCREPLVPKEEVYFSEPWFYGSLARSGLCLDYHDTMSDFIFDYPDYSISFDDKDVFLKDVIGLDDYSDGKWSSGLLTNRYAELYHWDYGLIVFENHDRVDNDELLIVGNSYTNSIERLLAADYARTFVIDPRAASESLPEFLTQHKDIRQILFLLTPEHITNETFLAILAQD